MVVFSENYNFHVFYSSKEVKQSKANRNSKTRQNQTRPNKVEQTTVTVITKLSSVDRKEKVLISSLGVQVTQLCHSCAQLKTSISMWSPSLNSHLNPHKPGGPMYCSNSRTPPSALLLIWFLSLEHCSLISFLQGFLPIL